MRSDEVSSTSSSVKGWTPLTTRLLEHGGSSAWNVIDGVVGEDVCAGVQQELMASNVFENLLPARTKGEVETDQLVTLLMAMQNNLSLPASNSPSIMMPTPTTKIRGDESIFLSRESRSHPSFSEQCPNLHQLIGIVQNTLVEQLSSTIQLDTAQTSVQLAVYPGDGQSGYVRHCDRGQGNCQHETGNDGTNSTNNHAVGRLVTAIYYLTDHDWSATDDGGALRVFHSPSALLLDDNNRSTDILPYRDRLVVFRADGVEHQVLPSLRRPRTAITMWFYGTLLCGGVPRTSSSQWSNGPERELTNETIKSSKQHVEMRQRATSTEDISTNSDATSTILSSGPPPLLSVPPPMEAVGENNRAVDVSTIFVGISSYRDSETVPTLQSLFSAAQYPNRIVVGLMLQLDDKEDNNLWGGIQSFSKKYPDQIRCLRMAAKDASGPCYARALCQSLHRGEDYFLQIDSHMRLRKNWDSYLVGLHASSVAKRGDNRVIFTTYPVGYTLPNTIPTETRGTVLVPWKFDDTGLLRQRGRMMQPRADPVPCYLVAAGFFFGPGRIIREVPYDPTLHQLFFGEELSLAVRFFTHGYACYAPPETVCYHLWSRAHRPTQRPISSLEKGKRKASLNIVRNQLRGENESPSSQPSSRYGVGTLRTVQDFAKLLGVDFVKRTFLRDEVETGTLSNQDFVPDQQQSSTLYPQESLEHKVSTLDLNTRQLISRFLPSGGQLSMG